MSKYSVEDQYLISGIKFKLTCLGCPEQYDCYVDGSDDNLVGYVRLRWGRLTCTFPDVEGEDIFHA